MRCNDSLKHVQLKRVIWGAIKDECEKGLGKLRGAIEEDVFDALWIPVWQSTRAITEEV